MRPDLQPLLDLLHIPSVSTLPEHAADMESARTYLVHLFESMGFTTQLLASHSHPAVFASRIQNPQLPTVLIYGHYDVQPADSQGWTHPPFQPHIAGDQLFGRGTTDNKCQFMIHVEAVRRILSQTNGQPPLNFKFIIEGEEEIGSPGISAIATEHKELLAANYIFLSDTQMAGPNHPAVDISLRGLMYAEVSVETSSHDLHSGLFGGVVDNPAIILARMISELKDASNQVLIPGFYEPVVGLTPEERIDYDRLEPNVNELLAEAGSPALGGGEGQYSINQRRWSRPTLDVNGLTSGYQGPGPKTIIPAWASAKISTRLVHGQDPAQVFDQLNTHLQSLCPPTAKVAVSLLSSALPYKAPTTHPVFALTKSVLDSIFGNPTTFQASGGTIGFVPVLAQSLNVPCVMAGFGLPGENLHAPNEHFSLQNYFKGVDAMVQIYTQLPTLPVQSS